MSLRLYSQRSWIQNYNLLLLVEFSDETFTVGPRTKDVHLYYGHVENKVLSPHKTSRFLEKNSRRANRCDDAECRVPSKAFAFAQWNRPNVSQTIALPLIKV